MRRAFIFLRIFVEQTSISLRNRMLDTPTRRFFLFVVLAALSALAAIGPASAQTITDTFYCDHSSTIDLGSLLAGGSILETLRIVDAEGQGDTVKFVNIPTGNIFLNDTNLIYLQADSQTYATTIVYSRTAPGTDSTSIVLGSLRGGCQSTYHIIAQTTGPDTNNSIIPLHHSANDIIAFKSDTTGQLLRFQFQNNFDSSITIDSFKFQKGSVFRIDASSVTFPVTIKRDSFFTLRLSFSANTAGFYTDEITAPNLPILPFSVQGLFQPNQAVQNKNATPIYVWLYPNPSQSSVTIHTEGVNQAVGTVTDVLGRVLATSRISGDWLWNRRTESGMYASAGTYFVIVTGYDASGVPVHTVKRMILQ